MYVIGTAGHVDHGKSRLVMALTGMDPDRLQEEKDRGLTIDLGFAWMALPSGREVSIIDVPGHERFIKNMLAGVGGIDLALFLVAADEGVMPQSREHLAILDLLQVEHGVVVLSKSDLVEPDWLDLVEEEVAELLRPTTLRDAPIVRCSAQTGDGIEALKATIDSALDALPPVRDIDRPRLPIDRAFTISGFGTVVTGTLVDGRLSVGQQVVIEPGGRLARVRGLQSHKKQAEEAQPGTRTAVNLGGVAAAEVRRGMVITTPGWLRPSSVMDVRLRVVADLPRPLKHSATVTLHTGAAEQTTRVRLLEGDTLEPGQAAWAQLRLAAPVAAARGDFFVLRSSDETVAGGRIVDTRPRRHKRNEPETLSALARLLEGSPDDALLTMLQRLEPVALRDLRQRSELERDVVAEVLERQIERGAIVVLDETRADSSLLATGAGFDALASKAVALAAEFVEQHPLRPGIAREELRSRLALPAKAFTMLERTLTSEGRLQARGNALDLPGREVRLSPEQEAAAARLLEGLRAGGARPDAAAPIDAELAGYLEAQGDVVRVSETVLLDAKSHAAMVEQVTAAIERDGEITLAGARDLLDTSRKIAQAFLEDLDRRRITRRVGDVRVLRSGG